MEIEYVFKHTVDGDFQRKTFTLDEVELGQPLDYIHGMRKDGYRLINRLFVGYAN